VEECPLPEQRAALVVGIDDELVEPGQSGQSHLGAQPEQVLVLDVLDPPPVEGVADGQVERISRSHLAANCFDSHIRC
jgi:hypothetical protein